MDFPLQYMLRHAGGVRVTAGRREAWGLLDVEAGDVFDGPARIKGKTRRMRIETGSLGELAIESTVVIGGAEYRVIDHNPVDDGLETDLLLQPA